jgi:hypothetical protein
VKKIIGLMGMAILFANASYAEGGEEAFLKGIAMGFWLGIFALIIAFTKYIYRKFVASKVEDLTPAVKAVVNHSKDTISQIKPSIATYVEKHQTTKALYCTHSTKALFCIHCGNKCEDDAAFCGVCGKAIEER